tara:strand:- start:4225 stop:4830 length:606 start_codon:yes stop_codon:yes gene_type:complete
MEKNKIEVVKYGDFIMSANIMKSSDCNTIIDFIETNKENFPLVDYNFSVSMESHTNLFNKNTENCDKVNSILSDTVSKSIQTFIVENCPNSSLSFSPSTIKNNGFFLRKIVGETTEHNDGIHIETITGSSDYIKHSVGVIVMSLKDTGDFLEFPDYNISVPLGEGSVVFFPPYWTHNHKSKWSGSESYRAQTHLKNTFKLK